MEMDGLKNIWPEWQIEKQLGRGSYGVVYKAVRRDHNVESYAAIKVISIPSDMSEVDTLRSEGLDLNATRTFFQEIVNDFVSEIQLMESLKGVQNIVSVEDYKVVEKTDEVGWNIYIRMELLTPFNSYICDKKLTEAEVIKLGCDICTALEICGKRNVIHRDIKPENIFINDFGDFKLGDFGIARKLENMTGGLSQKGTFNYMAPEVANSTEYDARVDTYSLGLVLYRLLNGNRLPFLNTEKQLLNPNERKNAVERRIRGAALPFPSEASPSMTNLILRACAYDPNQRFASATEMKQALINVSNGTYQAVVIDWDKTVFVGQTSVNQGQATVQQPSKSPQQASMENNINTFGEMPRKKRKPWKMIVGFLIAFVLIGTFVVTRIVDEDPVKENNLNEAQENTVKVEKSEKNSEEIDQNVVDEIIAEAEALAAQEDYEGALDKVQEALKTYPQSKSLNAKSDEYKAAFDKQVKENAITEAEALAQQEEYVAALEIIEEALLIVGEDEELTRTAQEYETNYIEGIIEQVDEYIVGKNFEEAEEVLGSGLQVFPENEELLFEEQILLECMVKAENACKYIGSDVSAYESGSQYTEYDGTSEFNLGGVAYHKGFTIGTCDEFGHANYNLSGNYKYIAGVAGNIDGANCNATYNIIGDERLLGTIDIKGASLPVEFQFDVTGVKQLTIVCTGNTNNGNAVGFGNVVLYNEEADKPVIYQLKQLPDEGYLGMNLSVYESGSQYEEYDGMSSFKLGGETFSKGFTIGTCDEFGHANYNLSGKYKYMTGIAGNVDGANCDATYNIIGDNKLLGTVEVKGASLPTSFEFDITGVKQLTIVSTGNSNNGKAVGFANVLLK